MNELHARGGIMNGWTKEMSHAAIWILRGALIGVGILWLLDPWLRPLHYGPPAFLRQTDPATDYFANHGPIRPGEPVMPEARAALESFGFHVVETNAH